MFDIGDTVKHRKHGEGKVIKIRNQGLTISVIFAKIALSLPSNQLVKVHPISRDKIGYLTAKAKPPAPVIIPPRKLDTKPNLNVSTIPQADENIMEIASDSEPLDTFKSEPGLYPWQKRALRKWYADSGKRGIVEAATGTGKTDLAFACMEKFYKDYTNGLVCIIVPRQAIFEQWQKRLRKYFSSIAEKNYCYIGNGHADVVKKYTQIIIITQQTMVLKEDLFYGCELLKILRSLGSKRNVLIVFDEAHHLGAKQTLVRFVEKIPDEFFTLGLTATPDRTDGQMDEVYSKFDCSESEGPIFTYSLAQAVEDKILAEVVQKNIKVSLNNNETTDHHNLCEKISRIKNQIIYNGVFQVDKEKIIQGDIAYLSYLQRMLNKRYIKGDWKILNLIEKIRLLNTLYFKRRELFNKAEAKWELLSSLLLQKEWIKRFIIGRWIFFHQGIDECEKTANLLKRVLGDQNIKLHHSKINKDERDKVLKDFNKNYFPCVCAAQTLDEGIDIPDLRGVVIVSGSTTIRQQVQRCGRALRRAPNKDCAYLVSILAQLDNDLTGEKLLIGPERSTNRWRVENYVFPEVPKI